MMKGKTEIPALPALLMPTPMPLEGQKFEFNNVEKPLEGIIDERQGSARMPHRESF